MSTTEAAPVPTSTAPRSMSPRIVRRTGLDVRTNANGVRETQYDFALDPVQP
ncbi:hypothetical protein M2275_002128 [Rhodococcus opacus]|nr:hypothetical protein [Rhodococcus opacus]